MKEFDYFLKKGDVKSQRIDVALSQATFKESKDRILFAESLVKTSKAKYVLENAYEAMREAADAVLYREGFKSYSHEASINYLAKKDFPDHELRAFDRFRKIRNGIKYYGKDCSPSDATAALELAKKIIKKIEQLLHQE